MRTDNDSVPSAEQAYREIILSMGENLTREGLVDTPERAASAMAHLTRGYRQSLTDVVNGAIFRRDNDGMVLVKNIEFYSLCEHHMLPFVALCWPL